jgi:hypothetical protein
MGSDSGEDTAFEGDGECVERRLPLHRPSRSAFPGRVKRAGHEVETLQRGLLGGEVPASPGRSPVAGVEASIALVEQITRRISTSWSRRHKLRPRPLPQGADRRILNGPSLSELVVAGLGGLLGGRGVDRPTAGPWPSPPSPGGTRTTTHPGRRARPRLRGQPQRAAEQAAADRFGPAQARSCWS